MKKIYFFLLAFLLLAGFLVRLYRFSFPIADWHSWRQVDTSTVSRNFVNNKFDVLHPTYDDISNVQSGFDNPKGYRFVEFPVFNIFQAGLFKLFGFFSLEEWGRLVTIFSSTISILFIFLIVKKYASITAAFGAAAFFAFVPYGIYYGRAILPDPSMTSAVLGGIYFFSLWLEKDNKSKFKSFFYFFSAILFLSLSLLLKPYAAFFFLPLFYIAYKRFGVKMLVSYKLWFLAIVSSLPFIWWRWWIGHYPEGIPVSNWLFNGGNIRFTGAFFYWIFAERISKLILGYWGVSILIMGFLNSKIKSYGLFISFLASSLLYVFVIARGNVQHDYYQILILPTIAIFFGLGVDFLFNFAKDKLSRIISYTVLILCALFILMFGWYQVRDFFNINNPAIITAGKAVDSLTPENAKIVAPYNGDTTLLYYTKRKGWPSFENSLPELIKKGADYLLLVNPKTPDYGIGKKYSIVSSTSDYILFDLHKKP